MIVYGEEVVRFAESYLNIAFHRATGIGFKDGDRWQGAVVFDTYQTTADNSPLSLEASVCIIDKRCVTRQNIAKLLHYPFADANVKRLQLRCGRTETQKRQLVERMGFSFEGILREAWPFGGDCAIYSMLQHEWLHGQFSFTSVGTRSKRYFQSPDSI